MTNQVDDRSPLALAIVWASYATTIGLEMVLPALAGHWVDQRWDTHPWFLILGAMLGFAIGMWHLLLLTAKRDNRSLNPDARDDAADSPASDGRNEVP